MSLLTPIVPSTDHCALSALASILLAVSGLVGCDVADDPSQEALATHHHHKADDSRTDDKVDGKKREPDGKRDERQDGKQDGKQEGKEEGKHRQKRDEQSVQANAAESTSSPSSGVRWYATLHDAGARDPVTGQESVFGFGSDGRAAGGVLAKVPDATGELQDFRGMLGLSDGSLLVIAAWKHNTEILRFGPPGDDARRPFVGVFTRDSDANPLLVHPYCMTVGPDGSIYVSNQDSNTVTRYGAPGTPDEGKPLGRDGRPEVGTKNAGLVVPSRDMSKDGIKEVRGIAFAPDGTLLVADRGKGEVTRWDVARGTRLAVLASKNDGIETPIQLLIGPDGRTIYISDNKRNAVFTLETAGGAPRVFLDENAGIDAGSSLAIQDGHLYVGSRKARAILRFRLEDGAPDPQPFIADLPDNPEFFLPNPAEVRP
ncbi:MAG: hypothetical protein ACKO3W_01865 [bacterium]